MFAACFRKTIEFQISVFIPNVLNVPMVLDFKQVRVVSILYTLEMIRSDTELTLNSIARRKRQGDIRSAEMHMQSKYYFAQWVPGLWYSLLLKCENRNNFKE